MRSQISNKQQCTTPAAPSMVVTCEHGGNRIPAPYRELMHAYQSLLESHRGFDPGALVMARALASAFDAPLLSATVSRLLVDLNRSIGHPGLHSQAIRHQPTAIRQKIIDRYYHPYRIDAVQLVTQGIARRGRVIHISCHSFTPCLDGIERRADIGLLYDPSRQGESALCADWTSALQASAPALGIRRNFPYQGRNDGLTSALRKKFPSDTYIGIELELNQKNILARPRQWITLRTSIINALNTALRRHDPCQSGSPTISTTQELLL